MEVSILHILYAAAVVFTAGVVKGLTGFGFSLVAVPFLVVLLEPRTAIPVIIILNAVSNVPLFMQSRKWSSLGRIWPLIVSGIITIPLGAYLLVVLETSRVRMIVGFVICVFALVFLLGYRRQMRRERVGLVGAGLLSGILNGLISAGGPPAILFLSNQRMVRDRLRANLIAFFLFQNTATVSIHVAGGLVTEDEVWLAVLLLIPLAAGVLLGVKLVKRVPEAAFGKAVLAVVLAAGLMVVLSSLRAL